jgi:hypothetical protein
MLLQWGTNFVHHSSLCQLPSLTFPLLIQIMKTLLPVTAGMAMFALQVSASDPTITTEAKRVIDQLIS